METEITIEVFNQCSGSCTGCLLSLDERKVTAPAMAPKVFDSVIEKLVQYGDKIGTEYRPVFVFGDFPSMDKHFKDQFLNTIRNYNLKFGTTLTLVQTHMRDEYYRTIEQIVEIDDTAILDFTIDPFRMLNDGEYVKTLQHAVKMSPKFHMQVLLSEAVLERVSPEELSDILSDNFGEVPTTLGFTPTLSNLDKKNYKFDVLSASDYTKRFFSTNKTLRSHLDRELERFDSFGDYKDFVKYGFHVGSDSSLYPVSYTIFGDVILDRRNKGNPIGKILHSSIDDILADQKIELMSKQNDVYMSLGNFNCETCSYYKSCRFNGVGLIRKIFKDFENKTGSCYGPISMVS